MSFASGFRFRDFVCDASMYDRDARIRAVTFSVYTGEDLTKCAVVTVNTPHYVCEPTKPWEPQLNQARSYAPLLHDSNSEFITLFDARMGNVDAGRGMKMHCTTCRSIDIVREPSDDSLSIENSNTFDDEIDDENPRCTGHYGKIDLPVPLVHPLLLKETQLLLRSMCWKCLALRIQPNAKEKLVGALTALMNDDYLAADQNIDEAINMTSYASTTNITHGEAFAQKPSEMEDNPDNNFVDAMESTKTIALGHTEALQADNMLIRLRAKLKKAFFALCRVKCPHCSYAKPVQIAQNAGVMYFLPPTDDVALMQTLKNESPCDITGQKSKFSCLNPGILKYLLSKLAQNEQGFLNLLYNRLFGFSARDENSQIHFLIDSVLVPPNHSRSWQKLGDQKFSVVDSVTEELSSIIVLVKDYHTAIEHSGMTMEAYERGYKQLQVAVNKHFTNTVASFLKKSGIFRSNMMGKRVNQACRTVISPDTYLPTNGLCLSTKFASRLTFPESLAFCSEERRTFLVQCMRNGPAMYPGATHLEVKMREGSTQTVSLKGKEKSLNHIADRMLKNVILGYDVIVHRHVLNGDMVILNRQPTLHKSSMLGQRAVVTGTNYTMRFHYANCKGFNADFDGDEMNCHIPQGIKCHTEMKCLMDSDSHYFSASSGKPIRGLIQDHIVAAYRLTSREQFLSRRDFVGLLYEFCETLEAIPQPCLLKPQVQWSGKQLISEALKSISGVYKSLHEGLTLDSRCTTGSRYFCYQKDDEKNESLHVHRSEILTGVLDTSNLGLANKSLVHCIHDTYGPKASGQFLAGAGRLLSAFMKRYTLTIKISDLCIAEDVGAKLREGLWKMLDKLDHQACVPDESSALKTISALHTQINKKFYPHEALVRFPRNNLMLMTAIGARGSYSNAYQMMISLGQQYFDNRRISAMASGKVLPGTLPNDLRAKCFGFVKGRFISGIRPQEYFIHASAGRDGIIDTAVKTARSGYLQRCLIKGMESSVIQWDGSVHNGEGEIVQFCYGADGLDPSRNVMNDSAHVKQNRQDFVQSLNEQDHLGGAKRSAHQLQRTRAMLARCEPGEPVGLIAAQSLGEPSTQMTLNTFHHTGSTSSHVTEGIPRVRELLSFSTSNPLVTIPIRHLGDPEIDACNRVKSLLLSVKLDSFLSSSARKPFSIEYRHSTQGLEMDISLLFSAGALRRRQELMGHSDTMYRGDFIQSIIRLFKSLVSKTYANIIQDDKRPMMSAETRGDLNSSLDEIGPNASDAESEAEDTQRGEGEALTQTEVETDFAAVRWGEEPNESELKLMPDESEVKTMPDESTAVQECLTSWKRPSIRIAKSKRNSGISVVLDNLYADSFHSESDSFEVSCSMCIPSSAVVIAPDILAKCLQETPLQNSSISFKGDFTLCELYREKGKEMGTLAFQGTAATIANVKTLTSYIPAGLSFDWNAIQSSDPHDLRSACGIEAGRAFLENELNRVFQGYSVNFRHTMLVSDTVSHSGALLPYSRHGLVKAAAASPFLQMTFESGGVFLYECLNNTNYDALRSFSSSLIVGNKPTVGTNFGKLVMETAH